MGDSIPGGARLVSRWPLILAALVAFLTAFGVVCVARAEDALDVRGTKHGCADVTATGDWATLTSASLENAAGSSALAASLYWTEVFISGGSADVYLCEAAAASCGVGTGNKQKVPTAGAIALPLRGLGIQSIATYAANGTTFQICGFFRATQ